jgi:hypothetical protein
MKNKLYILLFTISATFHNCIDRIDLQIPNTEELVVVEGGVNNLEGPHQIKLSQSSKIGSNPNEYLPPQTISNAIIKLYEDNILIGDYIEVRDGVYQVSNESFKGKVGSSYHVSIEINSSKFFSIPEKIKDPIEIDELTYAYSSEEDVIKTLISTKDPVNDKNYYTWTWEGYYSVFSDLPDDIDCCARCYIHVIGNDILVYNDQYANGGFLSNKLITNISVDRPNDYLLEVTQHSISQKAYDFLNLLRIQKENQGGLLDPPLTKIHGNIYNSERPDSPVLGYFLVSGAHQSFIKIPRKDYYNKPQPPYLYGDCRQLSQSDTLKPKNWN